LNAPPADAEAQAFAASYTHGRADLAQVLEVPPGFENYPDGLLHGVFDIAPDPVQWFAHNRLPRGRAGVLDGLGGVSKTRLLYSFGAGAVLGRLPWAWQVDTTGSAALFLTEDTIDDMHRVLHTIGGSLDRDARARLLQQLRVFALAGKPMRLLELYEGGKLHEGPAYDWLMWRIDRLPKPVAFVGIDPALGVTEGSELDPGHQRRLGELADRIAIESGACVVLSAHAAKGSTHADEIGSHTARGSGALIDAVRFEYVLRSMTADEARRFGIDDRVERQRYVQLQAAKGNSLPPEAFAPVWLKRGEMGLLSGVSLEQVERGGVADRELRALEELRLATVDGNPAFVRLWRAQCISAGIIKRDAGERAQEKALERIRDALFDAALIKPGKVRGSWLPT
jgi:hypothetical protein